MSSGKCRRTSTLQASPRAAAAKNQFALESPTSSQSPTRQGRRDALRNLVFKGAGRRSTTYRGVRYREELDKYVSEIRPTRCSKKIWLGTYDTAEEAARAFDIGNLCCKKNLPLNFPDSPSMLKKISSGLSPEDARRAIAKLAKEVAHLEVTNRNLAPRTPERDEHHHDLLVQPAAASNQFIHHFASNQSIHQSASNQSVHHLAATGNSSHMYIEQLDDHIECAMEVATAMPIAGGGRSGSRSWEFQIGDVSLKDDLEDIPDLMDHYGDVFYLY